jgi:hypothetical protein
LAADEVASAATRLRAALQWAPEPVAAHRKGEEEEDDVRPTAVGLPTRAVPLLDLLDRAAAEHTDVLWDTR